MFNKIKIKLKKNAEVAALAALIIVTIISTSYYNYNKKIIHNNYKNTINNVYFKKTISHLFKNLEPKFKKIDHKISNGETFDNILKKYSINKKEISNLKKKLSKKININQLKTNQQIQFIIDQKNRYTSFIHNNHIYCISLFFRILNLNCTKQVIHNREYMN